MQAPTWVATQGDGIPSKASVSNLQIHSISLKRSKLPSKFLTVLPNIVTNT